jgi:hypothetical protein
VEIRLVQRFQYAFTYGLRRALRHWRGLLPLYLLGLLLGLLQTWPLLAAGALYNPFLGDLVGGGSDALVNLFLGSPAAAGATGAWLLVALLLAGLFGLGYNFFVGGILSIYTDQRAFWAGCRFTFWSFTALGALLLTLLALAAIIAGLLGIVLGSRVAVVAALLLIQLINVVGEYARVIAVVRERRNPFALLGAAAAFCARHLGGVLTLALLGLLLHTLLTVLYALATDVLAGSLLALLAQQLVVLAWLWVKLLRLAWAASYVQAEVGAPASDGSSLVHVV